ncbi:Uu.00g035040.m01.CDS01 [Anthostomella pinea]|uniref:Uu.00g035040.m01.CDS01 n=1 Tax=Anthostomella pinea TaxID=933095 RepID=A0AAI8VA69_9PEZI|nr:Uu.00g035040.m01.CDS01 [Anthostomella pinea]
MCSVVSTVLRQSHGTQPASAVRRAPASSKSRLASESPLTRKGSQTEERQGTASLHASMVSMIVLIIGVIFYGRRCNERAKQILAALIPLPGKQAGPAGNGNSSGRNVLWSTAHDVFGEYSGPQCRTPGASHRCGLPAPDVAGPENDTARGDDSLLQLWVVCADADLPPHPANFRHVLLELPISPNYNVNFDCDQGFHSK